MDCLVSGFKRVSISPHIVEEKPWVFFRLNQNIKTTPELQYKVLTLYIGVDLSLRRCYLKIIFGFNAEDLKRKNSNIQKETQKEKEEVRMRNLKEKNEEV